MLVWADWSNPGWKVSGIVPSNDHEGKKNWPFLVPNSETISLVNPTTSTIELLAQENEIEYFWKYAYYPTANLLVYCLNHRDDTPNILVAVDTTNGETQQIPQPEKGLADMTLAPDGISLVASNERGLHQIRRGDETWETVLPYGQYPVWSPDGSQLAFMDGESCLCVVPADGGPEDVRILAHFEGQCNPKTNDPFSFPKTPIWSPDGRFIWFFLTLPGRDQTFCAFIRSFWEYRCSRSIEEDGTERRDSLWGSIRNAWIFGGVYHHHRVGVVDLEEGSVWIGEEEWNALSWCPVKG